MVGITVLFIFFQSWKEFYKEQLESLGAEGRGGLAQARVELNQIEDHTGAQLIICKGAVPVITGNHIQKGSGFGIHIFDKGEPVFPPLLPSPFSLPPTRLFP